jgi:hypothetical protein
MSVRFGKEIQEVLRRGDRELTFGSDHSDPNRLGLFFWILQPRSLCAFLRPEGLRQRGELPANVFQQEPPLNDFGHGRFIEWA